ncbi:L-aspartate oxidase [Murimonas intestini]|uniref:L-aspartate oxidase n=1 Tax=Murimonas intestini TaxID=1337051 RepID=A0AB73T1W4_9FIRM|nr:L-aspartate oxidase [Murimonas intestini]MCR1842647.1 L-aspartate oxidase [Murimonas intestini]MCR1867306.1 L-aspartate oxidase [Murimonas intestini]MCR1884493.1 L-aspartate oxidase [Murimonas intestini]
MNNKLEQAYDAIVVGTGAAGLFTACCLPPDMRILMVTKDDVENSDSYLAQGGICVLKGEQDYESYFEDTMRAGRYENNRESVRIMIRSSNEIIKELISLGVDFDKEPDGKLSFTREGAHSTFRILHHKDVTGREITSKLISQIRNRPNVTVLEHAVMTDLIEAGNCCHGIILELPSGQSVPVFSKVTVLATGGIGGLFESSTNFRHITGDSFALALKHGIELENINYIQIHPTTLYSRKKGRRFLISESVRGEGAVLLNPEGERFVDELLPRDVVTDAIKKEMEKYQSKYVYLSLTHMPEDEIKFRFPNIYERCLKEGYDLSHDMIPVTPAQHYLMGGIKADTEGRTSMSNLFAVGETACNGVHGANRLASNSLLESLVFAKRAAGVISDSLDQIPLITDSRIKDAAVSYKQQQAEFSRIILNEIKRRDGQFYDKWCNNEN